MTSKYIFLILILFAVLIEVVADIMFKKWATDNKSFLFIVGMLLYVVGTVFWAVSLKYEYISKAISIFTIFNLILVVLVGTILFKEDLSSLNKVGIALGIISIVLIEM